MSSEILALLRVTRPPRARLALASLLGALTIVFGIGLMATAGYLISRAAEQPAILSLTVAIVAVRFFGIGRPVLRYLDRLVSHDLALGTLGRARTWFYERIEPLAPAQLSCYREGDLLSRLVADVDALQNLYLRGIGPVLVALVAGAVAVGAATWALPAAGLVLAVGLLSSALAVPALAGRAQARAGRRQAESRGRLSAELLELLGSAPEVVAYGDQSAQLRRVTDADQTLVRLARRDALGKGAGDALNLLVTGLTVTGVLAVAIQASGAGHLDRVLIAMLALLALASFEAVTPLSSAVGELSATVTAGRRLLEVTDVEVSVRDPAHPLPPPAWPFTVVLDGVRASYPGSPDPVLDGLSLELGPGERVALMGASGAGKTTTVNLLLRFLDPEAGRVTLAGEDLRRYRAEDVRRLIAVAGQESHLFSSTIRENVRLGRPEATDREIEDALRRARIWEWVSGLPEGLETRVGERGRELSGGQRQRIVLARTLLLDTPVLILDEPTAHLDPATATELMDDVFASTDGRTLLLITHRTEGVDLVDRVVTL